MAIKWIGNEGSHPSEKVSDSIVEDDYEIIDKALDLIYLKSDKKLKKLQKK